MSKQHIFLSQIKECYWDSHGPINNDVAAKIYTDWVITNNISIDDMKLAWETMCYRLKTPIPQNIPNCVIIDFIKWILCQISQYYPECKLGDAETQRKNQEKFLANWDYNDCDITLEPHNIEYIKETLLPKDKPDLLLADQIDPMLNQFIATVNECLCKSIY
jgi:hypothetical protein